MERLIKHCQNIDNANMCDNSEFILRIVKEIDKNFFKINYGKLWTHL